MQNLKSILERNIDLERQKLYKQQQYQAYQNQETLTLFQQEVSGIQKIFDNQNPLYSDFYLLAEIQNEQQYHVRLCAVREAKNTKTNEKEYYYRGHVVKKADSITDKKMECISELHAAWIPGQNNWAVASDHGDTFAEQHPHVMGNRNDLLKDFLNLAVKDIARLLEQEAESAQYY